ncbi:Asp/Glu/hydantoin racemase, partial [Vararia minispora EC-137]
PTMPPIRILIVNPNTTASMTELLRPLVERVLASLPSTTCDFFTAPVAPSGTLDPGALPSINSPDDAILSAKYCFPFLESTLPSYDGILVACYSEHPLVRMFGELLARTEKQDGRRRYVIGIFEASVLASLTLLAQIPGTPDSTFAIVSTGAVWGSALSSAVQSFTGGAARFASCETTGLSASELHSMPPEAVRQAMVDATARLMENRTVKVICLGCAGMAGLEAAVREGAARVLGERKGGEVRVVDGVVAGVSWLVAACSAGF